jgi:hypothetical protein
MTTRRQPLLIRIVLALLVVLSGPQAGWAGHAGVAAGPGLTSVICGETGPRTIVVDAAGNPVEEDDDRSRCDGACVACGDLVAVPPDRPAAVSVEAVAANPRAARAIVRGHRFGIPQARAPPETRS